MEANGNLFSSKFQTTGTEKREKASLDIGCKVIIEQCLAFGTEVVEAPFFNSAFSVVVDDQAALFCLEFIVFAISDKAGNNVIESVHVVVIEDQLMLRGFLGLFFRDRFLFGDDVVPKVLHHCVIVFILTH